MRRIRLKVSYDGTGYHGWQIQNNGVTVEQRLRGALFSLMGEQVELIGASRTDAGVHALGNVAVFDTDSGIPAEKFAKALNRYLPDDIRVLQSEEVAGDFHPRYHASIKTYEYTVLAAKINIPLLDRYAYHVYQPLCLERMRAAAELLVGEHDFSAFCAASSQTKTKVRTICHIQIEEKALDLDTEGKEIFIRVSGNGFLYNMVRIIAGTLLEIGMGRRTADSVKEALETGNRACAGPTAPARGLTLVKIEYAAKHELCPKTLI